MTCLVLGAAGAAIVRRPLKPMAAASLKSFSNGNAHGLPRRVTQRRVTCETCAPSSASASRLSILQANSSMNGIAPLARGGGCLGTSSRSNHFLRAAHPTTATAARQRMTQRRRFLSTKNVSRNHQSSQKSSQHQSSSSRASSSILSYSSNTTAYLNPTSTPNHPLLRLLSQSLRHALLKPRSLPLPRYISPQHFTFTLSECFGHSSFILVALSYYSQDFWNCV